MAKKNGADDGHREDQNTGEPAKASDVRKVISGKKLKELLAAKKRASDDISEIAGGVGAKIAEAVETKNLNKRVFGMVARLDRLPPEKLVIDLDDLDHYLDVSGLRDRAAKAPRLPMDGEKEEGDDDAETNVRSFPAPRGVAAE